MSEILKRSQVDPKMTWDLTTIFKSDEAWEKELDLITKDLEQITKYENTMLDSKENIKTVLKLEEELGNRVARIYTYAHLKNDEDTTNSKYQEYNSKAVALYTDFETKTVFVSLALLEVTEEQVKEYFADPELKIFEFFMEKLIKSKEHVLSKKEEEIIANMGHIMQTPSKTFSMLNNADIKFNDVVDSKGEVLPMNHSRYQVYMESNDRVLRENAYNSMYEAYKNLKNTFATTLEGVVLNHMVTAKLKKYTSSRNAALTHNYIDEKVYDALIHAVNDKLPLLHQYIELRKKLLKVDEIHMYDLHTNLVDNVDLKFTFEEAKEIILEAISVLGEEYVGIVKRAFDERWIDYAENEGKRSGAYSSGSYTTNPFILISWKGTIDNLFTLIHELGHSLHSYYTRNFQPAVYGYYTIFLAEVASITNEVLLSNYLMNKYKDNKEVKAYLLNNNLDSIRGTLFRQTQFAEFEYEMHKSLEEGKPLTADYITKLYGEINEKYYGKSMTYDDNIPYEWTRIPHFYYNFYVYQYATGISAAYAFAHRILTMGEEAVELYKGYLKAGASKYPLDVLKEAGVDMSTNEPVYSCLAIFEENLKEFEKLI